MSESTDGVRSVEDAYEDWARGYSAEEMAAFKAGWVAAIRNKWAEEVAWRRPLKKNT